MKPYRTGNNLTGLQDLIREHVRPPLSILEIGAFVGDSTREFAKAGAVVLSVDPWDEQMPGYHVEGDILEAWRENTKGLNVVAWRGTAGAFYRDAFCGGFMGVRFDMAYIDAVHTYDAVRFDIENCERILAPGGILAGHDYCPANFPGVVQAVDEAAARLNLTVKTYADTSWVLTNPSKP